MIKINLNDHAVQAALNSLLTKAGSLKEALDEVGDYLIVSTRERFDTKTAPDGTKWQANSALTQFLKGRNDPLIGESDALKLELRYNASRNNLEFGSTMEYAAMQHFGGKTSPRSKYPSTTIPARPFVGLSESDEMEVLDIVRDYLAN